MVAKTDTNGVATVFLDASKVDFEFEYNEINVVATTVGEKLEEETVNTTITVQRVVVLPNAISSISFTTINEGENVSISVAVSIGESPASRVTVEFIATEGGFPASTSGVDDVYLMQSGVDGSAATVWVVPGISTENATFYITVNIISDGKVQQISIYEITVFGHEQVTPTSSTSLDLSDTSNPQTAYGCFCRCGYHHWGFVAVFIVNRKSKG